MKQKLPFQLGVKEKLPLIKPRGKKRTTSLWKYHHDVDEGEEAWKRGQCPRGALQTQYGI